MLLESGKFQPVAGSEEEWDTNPAGDKWVSTPLNNFVFIVQDENLAIFVNGNRIVEFNELGSYGNKNFLKGGRYMDNFKFWNLSGVEFNQ